ncbi:carbohydrate esterase family 16 protein [Cylindrobasidium torrendii FP15055 ss-10]|uniref:Carbohydrate esterase family 16 protein n=1 Tax=Cylindrobasidium torrendii FP15055 ss-10 TaxID=1314674 RepID=A0A0D7BTJ4_9AGAR|nr:carbohydrate esterase family 16 protein [Cylindrobasidium torrendii FP15055 ss-10]
MAQSILALLPFVTYVMAQNTWFSFGDSYTQTGFNMTIGPLPSSGNPLGNPTYPGWTATGGENWVDYETTTYNTSEVLTYNFAYGGATIDADLVTPYTPEVFSLTDQVDSFFLENLEAGVIPTFDNATTLFSVWIGINDIGNSFYLSGDRDEFSDVLLDAYFALVDKLVSYAVGARNFLFANVPPVQRSPAMLLQNEDSRALEESVITGYNAKLVERADALAAAHSDVQTFIWDSYSTFNKILDDPTTYGFTNITGYGDGEGFFWGNDYHPSSYAHKFFGEDVGTVLGGFI